MQAELITVNEAASILNVHPRTVTSYTRDKRLAVVYLTPRCFRYKRSDLLDFIERCTLHVSADSEIKFVENVADDCVAEVVMKDASKANTSAVASVVGNKSSVWVSGSEGLALLASGKS